MYFIFFLVVVPVLYTQFFVEIAIIIAKICTFVFS